VARRQSLFSTDPYQRFGSRRSLMVFAGNLWVGTNERLETATRATHPLINEEGRLGGASSLN
jgi:hypothetical protein